MPIFIIEHLEKRLWPWCIIEYKNISQMVGKKHVWFANVSTGAKLRKFGRVTKESVTCSISSNPRVCVLDPVADKQLTPQEAQKFDYFVLGGILGDYPPQKRTKNELTKKIPGASARNLGHEQMSTDTAVYVVHEIFNGKKLSDFSFQGEIEIPLGKNESTVLPYRYVLVKGKPMISDELVNYLKKRKSF